MTRLIFGDACKPKLAPQLYITSILVFTVSIEYVLQDDGTRIFVEPVPTSVDAKRKLTTMWTAIKSK